MSKKTMCKSCGHDPKAIHDRIPDNIIAIYKRKYRAILRLKSKLERLEEEFENEQRFLHILYDTRADLVCAKLQALAEFLNQPPTPPEAKKCG
jgi:ribosomal 50S subunit-associated protein YjgA (DUF615 family)